MVSVIKLALRVEDAFFIVSTVLRNQSYTFNVVSVIKVYVECSFGNQISTQSRRCVYSKCNFAQSKYTSNVVFGNQISKDIVAYNWVELRYKLQH